MSKFWKTKMFSEINNEWQKKLADSGFVDIEKDLGEEKVLKRASSNAYRGRRTQDEVDQKINYYRRISHSVEGEKSITRRDYLIMSRYSNGIKQVDILKELKQKGIKCQSRVTITRVITRYLCRWNIPLLKPRKTK